MVPEPGEYVGPYEILGQLGAGGMGIVYRAWDERLHREVALKLLHNQYDTPNVRERFLIEARAASALNHPNICTIFDLGEQDGEPYLVMELLTGHTLKEKVAHGVLATEEVVRTSIEVADALTWAHSKGVVHRDIKPANIFLLNRPGGSSQAKVLDFGLAKVTASSRSGRASRALELTSAGTTVGTLAYMSPEQARGESIDARSDLFSLGIIMYEMCTRRVPFQGATSAMVFTALLTQDPESIRTWNDAIPRDLERVVYRLLAKSRTERFQTAHELHEALRRLTLKGEGDWLRRLPRPSIPLVISADPVARAPRGRKGDRGEVHTGIADEAAPALRAVEEDSDPEHHLLRPRRLPRRESGPRESAFGSTPERRPEVQDPMTRSPENATRLRLLPESRGAHPIAREQPVEPQEGSDGQIAQASPAVETRVSRLTAAAPSAIDESHPGQPATEVLFAAGYANRLVLDATETAPPTIAVAAAEPPDNTGAPAARSRKRRALWATGSVVALIALGVLLGYKLSYGSLTQVVLRPGDAVLLAPFQNKTGESDLDRSIAQGLEIELAENSRLHFDGLAAFRAGVRQVMEETHAPERTIRTQAVAQKIGARAYLYGELSRSGSRYMLALTIVDAASNDRMATVSAESSNRDGLAAAITDISIALRRRLGEVESADARHLTPLSAQGTGNMAALQSYADGGVAVEEGRTLDAIHAYQRAAALSPGFTLAQVRLAWLLADEGAEVEAAEAAHAAQSYSRRAGDRVTAMAQYTRQALADRDLAAAVVTARAMTVARPEDVESLMALAHVMMLGGHLTEALLSSEQAVLRGPFHAAAYDEQARALLGLGRPGDAVKLRGEAIKAGVVCACSAGPVAYLSAGQIPREADEASEMADPQALTVRALALDNAGRLAEGYRVWRAAAAAAQTTEGLGSAAGGALAQAALDRALVGRCNDALALVNDAANLLHGQVASLRTGVADALCGVKPDRATESLGQNAGLHSQATELYLPILRAADALRARQPLQAIGELSAVREQRDLPPLASYLRGTARLAGGQSAMAAEDFRAIEEHRGRAFLSGTALYGPALASLVRAQIELRDQTSAARARGELQRVYADADPGILSLGGGGDARQIKTGGRRP